MMSLGDTSPCHWAAPLGNVDVCMGGKAREPLRAGVPGWGLVKKTSLADVGGDHPFPRQEPRVWARRTLVLES